MTLLSRLTIFASTTSLAVLAALPASAQPPAPAATGAATPEPAPAPPAPPAPGTSITVPGGYTCAIGEHAGVDDGDARTTIDVVCHALASHHARPGAYDVRTGKLGTKLLLVLVERDSGAERRLFVQGPEEIPLGADRLIQAITENKAVEQTLTADNVVSSETPAPQQKQVQTGVFLGITGMEGIGVPSSPTAGVELDIDFRLRRISLLLQGRTGGIGSAGNGVGYGSLGAGGRYFFADADLAPFAGAGLSFAYFQANQSTTPAYSGSGLAGYAEVGLAFFRSSRAGAQVTLRSDLPMFSLNQTSFDGGTSSQYVVPVSLNVGLSLR